VTVIQDCTFDIPHCHEYPDDWEFGGPAGTDPRADPRWRGSTYTYLDATLHQIHLTQAPLCDSQALDEFTLVASWGLQPVYLQVKRPSGEVIVLPWQYNEKTDEMSPL
jgi:hypothetical protein